MDPVGFALENFDAVGRWRTTEEGQPVDAAGGLPDGSQFAGVAGLEAGLLKRPELFVGTLTEKLLTFALGRGVEYSDGPGRPRDRPRRRRPTDYRFSALIVGIVTSTPFQMRTSPMIISKKALPRRTFLRGVGAALALPLLDAMVPAADRRRPRRRPPRCARLGFVFMPMGCDITALDARRARTSSTSCRRSSARWRRSRSTSRC